MMKGSINQEDIATLEVYVPNKSFKILEKLVTERRNRQTSIIVQDFNLLLSVINRSTRQIMRLQKTPMKQPTNLMYLTFIEQHTQQNENTPSSSTNEIFTKITHSGSQNKSQHNLD